MIASLKHLVAKRKSPAPSPVPARAAPTAAAAPSPAPVAPAPAPAPAAAPAAAVQPERIDLHADIGALIRVAKSQDKATAWAAIERALRDAVMVGYSAAWPGGVKAGAVAATQACAQAFANQLPDILERVRADASTSAKEAILARLPSIIAAAKSEPAAVTVHNEVVMPQRAVRAVQMPDGSTLMTPEGEPVK